MKTRKKMEGQVHRAADHPPTAKAKARIIKSMTHEQSYSTYTQEYQAVINDLRQTRRVNTQRYVRPLEMGLLKYDLTRIGSGIMGFGGTAIGLQVGETVLEKGLYAGASFFAATLLYSVVKRRTNEILEQGRRELENSRKSSLEKRVEKEKV